jgi:hypothetical protein
VRPGTPSTVLCRAKLTLYGRPPPHCSWLISPTRNSEVDLRSHTQTWKGRKQRSHCSCRARTNPVACGCAVFYLGAGPRPGLARKETVGRSVADSLESSRMEGAEGGENRRCCAPLRASHRRLHQASWLGRRRSPVFTGESQRRAVYFHDKRTLSASE